MKINSVFSKALAVATVVATSIGFQSCLDDDDNNAYYLRYPNALVTVKEAADGAFFLQLDDKTTLLPTNVKTSPFGDKEVRALMNYSEVDEASGEYTKAVHINWIDSILTKPIAPDLGEENDKIYGTDPVEIVNDWVTVWGGSQKHFVNLLLGQNPDNPYEVEFRHNAYGDTYGKTDDGLVAFKLDELPDTEGKTVKLKLKWKSFSGDKSAEFDYCTRKSVAPSEPAAAAVRSNLKLK